MWAKVKIKVKQKLEDAERILDKSTPIRILVCLVSAYFIMFVFEKIELIIPDRETCQNLITCLTSELLSVISVDNLEQFSILVVGILYLLETSDRKKKKHFDAWQVIDNCVAGKLCTSYARIKALEDLNEDGVYLCSVDLSGADLKGINLRGANLKEAILSNANLNHADLSEANLQQVNLNEVSLVEADLSGAKLQGANLRGANLRGANLSGANLKGANLSVADLTGALLEGVNLVDANIADSIFRDANLKRANLKGARLRESNLKGADFTGANMKYAIMPDGEIHKKTTLS